MGLLGDDEDEEDYASENSEAREQSGSNSNSNSKAGEQSGPLEGGGVDKVSAAAPTPRLRQDGGGGGGGGSATYEADDSGENLPKQRESVFSAGSRWDRRSSQVASNLNTMPEIPIRRRTRVAAEPSSSPPPPIGAIARASRIITELELEQGAMRFPLDSLRGGSSGFENDEDGGEDESTAG